MSLFKKKSGFFKAICLLLSFLILQNNLEQVQAQGTPFLPLPQGYFLNLSKPYSLPVLRGMRVYPDKPFEFGFVVDAGDRQHLGQKETALLVKYFLTCLTIPQEDLWVNLSPYESGRIIPNDLALTDAGNSLLEQDKLLKQLASSLTYPESKLGKKFWDEVYKRAYKKFGTTDLPVNTYNKVWIVPSKAVVYDMGNSALIGDTHLKVMLDVDYLAMKRHLGGVRGGGHYTHDISAQITREIILPQLEREINEGKNFAPVRQIFHSMVLAAWFKNALKRHLLSSFYVNKKKISGVDGVDKNAREAIYKQYLRIYRVGAYNYIRDDVDPISQQTVPRKYFSGGAYFGRINNAMITLRVSNPAMLLKKLSDKSSIYGFVRVVLKAIGHVPKLALAQPVSRSSLVKVFASVIFALTLLSHFSGSAQAAQFTPSADGKIMHVLVEKNDTLGQILLDAGYKYDRNHYWSPDGTVVKAGEAAQPKITDIDHIFIGQEFDIPAPGAVASAKVSREAGQKPDVVKLVKIAVASGAPSPAPPPSPRPELGKQFDAKAKDGKSALSAVIASAPIPNPAPLLVAPLAQGPQSDVEKGSLVKTLPTAPAEPATQIAKAKNDKIGLAHIKFMQRLKQGPSKKNTVQAERSFGPVSSGPVPSPVLTERQTLSFSQTPSPELQSWDDVPSGDIIYILPPRAEPYPAGTKLAEIVDDTLQGNILNQEKVLAAENGNLENAIKSDAPPLGILSLKEDIAATKSALDKLYAQRSAGIITAPFDVTILPGGHAKGHINAKEPLFPYYAGNIFAFNYDAPASFNPNSMSAFYINDERVMGLPKIIPTSRDGVKNQLHIVVRTQKPMPAGEVKVKMVMSTPANDPRFDGMSWQRPTAARVDVPDPNKPDVITSTLAGHRRDLVVEGQEVVRGQVLSIVWDQDLINEYNEYGKELSDIGEQLKNPQIQAEVRDGLKTQQTSISEKMDYIRNTSGRRMLVLAPHSGKITKVHHDNPDVEAGGAIMEISSGVALLNQILVNQDFPLKTGDPFYFKTAYGELLPGIIRNTSETLANATKETGSRHVVGQVFDPKGQLSGNEWGTVIWPKTQAEQEKILAMIHEQEAMGIAAGAAGGTPPEEFWNKLFPPSHQETVEVGASAPVNLTAGASDTLQITSIPGLTLIPSDLNSIASNIANNPLIAADSIVEAKKAELGEKLLTAIDVNLILGGGFAEGKFSPGVGLSVSNPQRGEVQGLWGPLYGLQSLFLGATSNLIPQLPGGQNDLRMQEAQQIKVDLDTQVSEDKLNAQVEAMKRAFKVEETERDFVFVQNLLKPTQQVETMAQHRESGGWLQSLKAGGISLDASGIQTDPELLKIPIINASNELEGFQGKINKIDGTHAIAISTPKRLVTINAAGQAALWAGVQANNLGLKYAQGLIDARGLRVSIAGLDGLKFNFSPEYLVKQDTNPIINPSQVRTTSAVTSTPGFAPSAILTIPIHNESKDINVQLTKEDRQAAELNQQQTKITVKVRFENDISIINRLAPVIASQTAALNSFKAQVENAGLSNVPPEELLTKFKTLIAADKDINGLWTQYSEAWADLHGLGAVGMNGPLIPSGIKGISPLAIAPSLPAAPYTQTIIVPGPAADPQVNNFNDLKPLPAAFLRAGEMTYPGGPEGFRMFIEASTGGDVPDDSSKSSEAKITHVTEQLNKLREILIDDSNIFSRALASELLFSDYRGQQDGFLEVLNDIAKHSPYPDVKAAVLDYAANPQAPDVSLIFNIINTAENSGNASVANMGYRFLSALLTEKPQLIDSLSQPGNFKGLSYGQVRMILATFIAHEPVDSKAKWALALSKDLDSTWWAQTYANLEQDLEKNAGSDDHDMKQKFADFAKEMVLRRVAINQVPDSFSPGSFYAYFGNFFPWDITNKYWFSTILKEEYARFVQTSPANIAEYIKPDLLRNIQSEADTEIRIAQMNAKGGAVVYDLAGDQMSIDAILDDFHRASQADQDKHIEKWTKDVRISYLYWVLQSPHSSQVSRQNAALGLMKSGQQGQVLALRAYLDGDSPAQQIIEDQSWASIKGIVNQADNPGDVYILRHALEGLSKATGGGWANARALTYTIPELNAIPDEKLKEAAIGLKGAHYAPAIYRAINDDWVQQWIPGTFAYGSPMDTFLNAVSDQVNTVQDPVDFDFEKIPAFHDGESRPELKNAVASLETYAADIKGRVESKDYNIPPISWLLGLILFVGSSFIFKYLIEKFMFWWLLKRGTMDQLIDDLKKKFRIKKDPKNPLVIKVDPVVYNLMESSFRYSMNDFDNEKTFNDFLAALRTDGWAIHPSVEGIVFDTDFSNVDRENGAAIFEELITKGILERVPGFSNQARLVKNGRPYPARPHEIQGGNFNKIWHTLIQSSANEYVNDKILLDKEAYLKYFDILTPEDWKVILEIKSFGNSLNDRQRKIIKTLNRSLIERKHRKASPQNPLWEWREIVKELTPDPSDPGRNAPLEPQRVLKDLDQIRLKAKTILTEFKYTDELVKSDLPQNGVYNAVLDDVLLLAIDTKNILLKRLASDQFTGDDRVKLGEHLKGLSLIIIYVNRLIRLNNQVGFIYRLLGHKEAPDSWVEKFPFIGSIFRALMGITPYLIFSERLFKRELREFLNDADKVIPGVYHDQDAILKKSADKLEMSIKVGSGLISSLPIPSAEIDQSRQTLSNTLRLISLFIYLSYFPFHVLFNVPLYVPISSLSYFCGSILVFWVKHHRIYGMEFSKVTDRINEILNKGFKDKFGFDSAMSVRTVPEKIVDQAQPAPVASRYEQPARSKGGIDLNFQPQFIRRGLAWGPANFKDADPAAGMPDAFKGFNFNIVRFTTQLTASNAFELMFNSK